MTAPGVDVRGDDVACSRTLDRLFPHAARSDDPWQDLLTAGGRTPETAEAPWTWDSTVRR